MRIAIALLGACALTAAGAVVLSAGGAAADDGPAAITWLTDLDAARAEARKTGRPIFAVFT